MFKEGDKIIIEGTQYKVLRKIHKPYAISLLEDENGERKVLPNLEIKRLLGDD